MITRIFGTQITQIAYGSLAVVMILGAVGVEVCAYAEEPEGALTQKSVIKEMIGPIIHFTPRNNPEVIYVGNDAENTDYSFIIDKNTKTEHVKNLAGLKTGDMVKVRYEEMPEIAKMGGRKVMADKRVAKVISFVKAGAQKEEPGSAPNQKPKVLVSY